MPAMLMLPACVYNSMGDDALAHPGNETGGTILGVRRGTEFIGAINIPAGSAARRTAVNYSPDTAWQQQIVDVITQRLRHLAYIADWHIHPGSFDRPSAHDLRTARHIVSDSTWDSPAVVFPIGVREMGKVRFRAYLMKRETLEFEEIPIVVLQDHDPRVITALTGMDATNLEAFNEIEAPHDTGGERRGRSSRSSLRRFTTGIRNRPTG